MKHQVEAFFDPATATVSYVVYEAPGGTCAIIDSVLDYDGRSGRTATHSADRIAAFVEQQGLQVEWLLETHAHADHVSAARYLKQRLGGKIAVGAGIRAVQQLFDAVYNVAQGVPAVEGTQGGAQGLKAAYRPDYFDHLFDAGEIFKIGKLRVCVWHVPGHTPADTAYIVEADSVFTGDTLFMPDVGTARCDFPGGDAATLYASIRRLLALPPATRLYLCHDYPPPSRMAAWTCTVGEQRAANIHMHDGVDEAAFVALRHARDAGLALPALMLPAVQINIRAGELPAPEQNGVRYLKIPLDVL